MDIKLCVFLSFALLSLGIAAANDLLLVTVATDHNDGLRRYLRSARINDLNVQVFGLGEKWQGGDMTGQGGGHKINILKKELEKYKDQEDLIIMFTDSYDVVLTAGKDEIIEKFRKFDARVVFSAEGFCWPDKSLYDQYPEVKINEKRFLCSGGFIGYAPEIYSIISHTAVDNTDDDQLYYTNIFLDKTLREKWSIKLDKKSELFINLHGALGDIMLKFKGDHSFLYNVKTGTVPIVIHGNGPIKPEFNRLANYLADGWTPSSGCVTCGEETISLDGLLEDDYPTIMMGIFVERPTPFLRELFKHVAALDYPKSKISVFMHNTVERHQQELKTFLLEVGQEYESLRVINPMDEVTEADARNSAIDDCIKMACQYFLNIDGDVHVENSNAIKLLMRQNRSVIAPMISRHGKAWSNFWGGLSSTGFYARSEDYMDIVNRDRVGLWNVPYMGGMYLIQAHVLPSIQGGFASSEGFDADMALCATLRDKGVFMFVTNRDWYGHLINTDDVDIKRKHPELYQIFNNPLDWERRYIHENYSQSLAPDSVIEQPCPDVFYFPIMTEMFCDEIVEEMEYYGGWSGGKNNDDRLATGYENVPTDDIHMTQVDLQEDWLEFLQKYVSPLQQKVYPGYDHDPPRAILNFIVKYNPERQRELRPHHDSSTFTINIALNTPHVDYEGGGCRFIRYNCSIIETRKGWMAMHPGRLTHYHEGLQIKSGTRYIFVSFVDP
ncbi:multifunctional procollagen lysine hydroxylase and glycosyltransferase LH3-like isoform X2 [Mya arenaria]|uniref:multifunctional procollagen lysine hydroxylase and glycosyltransferase LH3-like isoform X2 n=1 Tax=Mya arenaria TaxID=6604 RepID=UPI0022DFD6EA|nr:multifunctional procollagen lysine hydroxylase and glycosyltransferase LH3-like isoform X2 [Mya arenaria]